MRQGNVLCWVYSTDSDTRKEEFIPPEHSPLFTGRSDEAYIEAVDDERFGICFGIPTSVIREYGADSVCVELNIDQGATSLALVLKVKDQAAICEKIDSFTCLKEGDWQECGFSFRKMDLDEDLILSHEEAKGEIKSFGTIKVTIMRGFSHERINRDGGIIPSSNRKLDQHISSKRVIKDNGISHSVNTPVLRSLPNRRGIPLKFHHLAQPNCHIATFIFRYRSQSMLWLDYYEASHVSNTNAFPVSLELKKIVGDDQGSRLEEGRAPRATKSPQSIVSEGVKIRTSGRRSTAFTLSDMPRPLKRESIGENEAEMSNENNTENPTKRRKSISTAFEQAMKLEPIVSDLEISEATVANYPPSA